MPRPKKYASEAERLEARRLQVRKNVEAFRQRKKQSNSQVPTQSRPQNPSTARDCLQTRSNDVSQPWHGNQDVMCQADLPLHQYDAESWYTSSNQGHIASSESSDSDRNQSTRGGSPVELDFTDLSLDFGQGFEADFDFLSAEDSSYKCNPFAIDPLLLDQEYTPAVPLQTEQYDTADLTPPDEAPSDRTSSSQLLQGEYDDAKEIVMSESSSFETIRSVVPTAASFPTPYDNLLPSIDKFAMTFGWLEDESLREGFGDKRTMWPWNDLRKTHMRCSKKANRLLEVAMVACCGVLLGQMRSDSNLINTAQEACHQTIHRLRKQLGNEDDSRNSHIKQNALILLTATWAVMLDEIYKHIFEGGTDGTRWLSHMDAILTITRLAGPKAFQSIAGTRIMRWISTAMLSMDSAGKIRAFMDTDAWRSVPYQVDGKTWQDRVLILAHRVQSVIHRAEEVIQRQQAVPDKAIVVWRDMAILRRALHAWYEAYEADMVDQDPKMNDGTNSKGRPLFWTRPTTGILSEDVWTLPEMIEYRDSEAAETLNFYFLCLFKLSTTAFELQENILGHFPLAHSSLIAFPLHDNDLLSAEHDIMPVAYHILGTVEEVGLSANNMHQFSTYHGTYTLRIVANWLLKEAHTNRRKRDILIWLKPVQEATGKGSAFGALGKHITDTLLGPFPELPAWDPVQGVGADENGIDVTDNANDTLDMLSISGGVSRDMMHYDGSWLGETLTMRDFELRPC